MTWLAGGAMALGFAPCARANVGISKTAKHKTGILTLMTRGLLSPAVLPPELVLQFGARYFRSDCLT
jgi:hypothetical protein